MTGFEYFSAIATFASAAIAVVGSFFSASSSEAVRDALGKLAAHLRGKHKEPPGN
ncbi:hypothetical protein ACFWJW_21570 [Streptomyces sp. NPDC127097]|uniref:hypothetical protein n=1 Tax=Streptomyces sp. NPDC127097 TaxID=3347136 RepID=UPI00365AF40A